MAYVFHVVIVAHHLRSLLPFLVMKTAQTSTERDFALNVDTSVLVEVMLGITWQKRTVR